MSNQQRLRRKKVKPPALWTHYASVSNRFYYVTHNKIYVVHRFKNILKKAHMTREQFLGCPSIYDRKAVLAHFAQAKNGGSHD